MTRGDREEPEPYEPNTFDIPASVTRESTTPVSYLDRTQAEGPRTPVRTGSDRQSRERQLVFLRDRGYRVSAQERELLVEIGKFRTIAVSDLLEYRYQRNSSRLRQDLVHLKSQNLLRERRVLLGGEKGKVSLVVLTREGKQLAQQSVEPSRKQTLYAGFVKPQELAHDAALYRMYQTERALIDKRGGVISRVILDFELKRRIYRPLAKTRKLPPLAYARRQHEVAAQNGLQVVEGKIPLPDLRIEYQPQEGGLEKVDLELATEHYHGRHAASKLKAGFKVYADSRSAARLNAALTYGRATIYDGPELTAEILSL